MSGALQSLLLCPILIILRIFVLGIALSWFLPLPGASATSTWPRRLVCGARALLVGTLVSALVVLALGQCGLYRVNMLEAAVLGVISLAGIVPALLRHRDRFRRYCLDCAPLAALCLCGIASVMSLPERDEWVFGGWDPGVYISEGVALSRTGTLHPDDPVFFESFSDAERAIFTRTFRRGIERFPGVLLDTEHQTLSYEFFRLHPSMVAFFHRCGGMTAAMRGNTMLGLFVCIVFFAMLLEHVGRTHAVFAVLVLMAQPLWLYHAHIPVSEMLQLLLIMGLGLMLPHRGRGRASPILVSCLILGLMLNRFSFLPFSGMLMAALAWSDLRRDDRRRVYLERGLQFAAIMAGVLIDAWVAPASLRGWSSSVMPRIIGVFSLFTVATVTLDLAGASARVRHCMQETPRWILIAMAWLCTGGLLALYAFGRWGHGSRESDNLYRLVPYLGHTALIVAIVGGFLLVHRRRRLTRVTGSFLLFLLGAALIVLIKKWAVDLYPWASRRYLVNAVPLLAILAATPMALLWQRRPRATRHKALALALLFVVLASNAKRSWHAFSRVETHGALAVLDDAAAHMAPSDIVVVDDPRWGMPLHLIFGMNILNGKHMWTRKDADQMTLGLNALKRLGESGKRIRFLTTTPVLALDIYPVALEQVTLDWTSAESVLEAIHHSSRAHDFKLREKRNVLRLFTWRPGAGPAVGEMME